MVVVGGGLVARSSRTEELGGSERGGGREGGLYLSSEGGARWAGSSRSWLAKPLIAAERAEMEEATRPPFVCTRLAGAGLLARRLCARLLRRRRRATAARKGSGSKGPRQVTTTGRDKRRRILRACRRRPDASSRRCAGERAQAQVFLGAPWPRHSCAISVCFGGGGLTLLVLPASNERHTGVPVCR